MIAADGKIEEKNFLRRLGDKPPYLALSLRKGIWKVGRVVLSAPCPPFMVGRAVPSAPNGRKGLQPVRRNFNWEGVASGWTEKRINGKVSLLAGPKADPL